MATRNIVPRATGEGQIGTSAKTWSAVYANDIAVTNGVTASTFTGDLTGDVTGDVTGNVTGDVTGDVTGTASGNLALSGGTMTGAISFDVTGEIGYRATTHDAEPKPLQQLVISSTDIDHWGNGGGGKIALHTYDDTQTNTLEDGGFEILASNGLSSGEKKLIGKPSGSLTWGGKEIERVNSIGSNYIRYENGIQICWGLTTLQTINGNADKYVTATFGAAFVNTDYTPQISTRYSSGSWQNNTLCIAGINTTSCDLYIRNNQGSAYSFYFSWFVIGKWK